MPLELLELLVPLPSFATYAIKTSERLHVSQARAFPRLAFPLFFDIRGKRRSWLAPADTCESLGRRFGTADSTRCAFRVLNETGVDSAQLSIRKTLSALRASVVKLPIRKLGDSGYQ